MAKAQFDREQVIHDSTQLFWQQGFSGASMQQVCKATGLKPGSLYLAFGSKEGLYEAALEHYAIQAQGKVRQTLENAPSVGEGICQVLNQMVEDSKQADYCSCFLIKSQLELATMGGELLEKISGYLGAMEELYTEFLCREYPKEQAHLYAASLMLHTYGIRVYGYLGRCPKAMLKALQSGLPWLPWDKWATHAQ
ncbi:TetR family transcriptional regulator [Hahella sp. CCB-MM4]|uniref:TetR/AcrR family transcriptional regulator n=1 Tax=Hahella sp. (strain CCB-MM4) TaxID=1926491 RepID=UPI000B9B05E8|nr:TetR/AcrR family transcriptional regulator [Hahella sp. CCB-MM4]OZG74597.1 TetR family transcriptional regulator [Hahella sp. CCB-MM4]